MINFKFFAGRVTSIGDFMIGVNDEDGCYKIMAVTEEEGNSVNFVIAPLTYFVEHEMITVGDCVTGYYDADAPVPMIFPPQYRALIISKASIYRNVKVDYFDDDLVSSDGLLKLNISRQTPIVLRNGQVFLKNPENRNLIAIYGPSTKSIPAQTTPYEIVIWCSI